MLCNCVCGDGIMSMRLTRALFMHSCQTQWLYGSENSSQMAFGDIARQLAASIGRQSVGHGQLFTL